MVRCFHLASPCPNRLLREAHPSWQPRSRQLSFLRNLNPLFVPVVNDKIIFCKVDETAFSQCMRDVVDKAGVVADLIILRVRSATHSTVDRATEIQIDRSVVGLISMRERETYPGANEACVGDVERPEVMLQAKVDIVNFTPVNKSGGTRGKRRDP